MHRLREFERKVPQMEGSRYDDKPVDARRCKLLSGLLCVFDLEHEILVRHNFHILERAEITAHSSPQLFRGAKIEGRSSEAYDSECNRFFQDILLMPHVGRLFIFTK